jgi:mRNA-capping enzyme
MMLINKENEIFFFDRDNSCFEISGLRFVSRQDIQRHLVDTLLDGEMVIDRVHGQEIPRFLVYDIVKFENHDLSKQTFYKDRLKCIEQEVINPRHEAMKAGLINRQEEPFSVRNKPFWDIRQAAALLAPKFAKTLSHDPDGLIFQPSLEPYKAGQCHEVLKWKPSEQNSVDFRLKLSETSGLGMLQRKVGLLFVGQMSTPFAEMKYTSVLKDLNNKIIECKYDKNAWVFMRERTDKSFPNSYNTAMSVCNSIRYPVTKEIMLNFIEKHRFVDDTEMMPPPGH